MCDKPGWLNRFGQFLCERLSSFNPKRLSNHMHGLAVYVKEGLPLARDLSLQNSADSYLCFRLALLHCVLLPFPLSITFSSLCTAFDSISSNIAEVLSINPSANVLAFGDFNVHHKDWLSYSGGTDRSGKLCYNFHDLK